MANIIPSDTKRRPKRTRTSFLVCAFLAIAGQSGVPEVGAFGVQSITPTAASASTTTSRIKSARHMKSEQQSSYHHNTKKKGRMVHGTPSEELIVRKAAMVDSSHLTDGTSRSNSIRVRVSNYIRSKKRKSKVVKEVKDVDSIHKALLENQQEGVYTAIMFHASYCRACKASMPLYEDLARQYKKKGKKDAKKQQQQRSNASSTTTSWNRSKQPVVRFLSVPVTQQNSKELRERFSVTQFPLARIYDPLDGLVDERPLLRKLFSGFERRLGSVLEASATGMTALAANATMV